MLGLPRSTEISKILTKKNIYLKLNLNTSAKEDFDASISKITIVNEISPVSASVVAGENVSRFFVVHILLKKENFSEKAIVLLSKFIPHKTIFVLEYEGRAALAVYETKLITNEFQPVGDLTLSLQGLNLDEVWSNIVHTIQGGEWNEELTVAENIQQHIEILNILKEIEKLEKQIKNEKQPKKKFELVQKMKKLKEKLIYD